MECEKLYLPPTKIEVRGLTVSSARAGLDLFAVLTQYPDFTTVDVSAAGCAGASSHVEDGEDSVLQHLRV